MGANNSEKSRLLIVISMAISLLVTFFGAANAQEKVNFGWIPVVAPYEAAFCSGMLSDATGSEVVWRKFDSGPAVIAAMASGEVPIALLGSTPAAAAISQGLEIDVFWVVSFIDTGEALIAHPDSGIVGPQDLKGKTLATPFGSTSHYHMLVALESFGINPADTKVVGMTPPEIAAAWARGDIDGAYIWDPALAKLKADGANVIVDSGQLARWGKAILNVLVVRRDWANNNRDFMGKFVRAIAEMDAAYREDPGSWSGDSENAKCLERAAGADPDQVPQILSTFLFPSLSEQATPDWLGGSSGGRVATWLKLNAEFLKAQNKISTVLPDYGVGVTDAWVQTALEND